MSRLQVNLTKQNSQKADELARATGKSIEVLVNEAFEQFQPALVPYQKP